MNKLILGDCIDEMKKLQENSIDSICCDPPYGIGFMGKEWDKFKQNRRHKSQIVNMGSGMKFPDKKELDIFQDWCVEWATECLRVLKPGGHILSACGTRTYHRMACAVEDAGFEIRDCIAWIYGSGFPKSLNIGKSVNQFETKEWSRIGKALDNIDKNSIIKVWKSKSNNVRIVEIQSLKNQIIAGQDTPSESFAVLNVAQSSNQENSNLLVSFVGENLNEVRAINTKTNIVLQNVETEIRQLQNNVKSVGKQSQDQNLKSWNIFIVQCDVKEWLNENTEVNHKVDEVLKILRGNEKYSNEEIIDAICVILTNVLKLTILNQSKTFQSLDMKLQMECVSATNVIITEYIAENLILNTVDILKGKVVDKLQGNKREELPPREFADGTKQRKTARAGIYSEQKGQAKNTKGTSPYEGQGTSLKPAMELWVLARKPLSEKTIAKNVLKWGTGGLNIDGCRVEFQGDADKEESIGKNKHAEYKNSVVRNAARNGIYQPDNRPPENYKPIGRFPANLIHDGSKEVVDMFPETKSQAGKKRLSTSNIYGGNALNKSKTMGTDEITGFNDSGSAARFFYCAKASKSERNKGLDGFEEKTSELNSGGIGRKCSVDKRKEKNEINAPTMKNSHPTIKPIKLMQYLCRLITPKGGTVLDPFMGSGSTGIAAKIEGFNFIGIEKEKEYIKIAEARIKAWEVQTKLL